MDRLGNTKWLVAIGLCTSVMLGGAVNAWSQPQVTGGAPMHPAPSGMALSADGAVGLRPSFATCIAKDHLANQRGDDCGIDEFNYQDDRLNRIYRELLRRATAHAVHDREGLLSKDVFVIAQRQWLLSMPADCEAETAIGGSSRGPETSALCRARLTAARARQLEVWSRDIGP